jgi:hypothetical protein
MSSQPTERAAIVATIDPQNGNNAATSSDAVDMSKFHEAMFILATGVIDETVDFKLQESDASGGSYTDITGKAITQLAATDDNKQAVITLKSEELGTGKRHVKAVATVGNGSSSLICVIALGMNPRFGPASDDDLSSVVQIVN